MSSMDEHTGKMHAHTIDVYAAVKQYSFKNIFSYSSFCPCDETQTKSNLRKRGFLRLTGYSLFLMEPRAETQSGTQSEAVADRSLLAHPGSYSSSFLHVLGPSAQGTECCGLGCPVSIKNQGNPYRYDTGQSGLGNSSDETPFSGDISCVELTVDANQRSHFSVLFFNA